MGHFSFVLRLLNTGGSSTSTGLENHFAVESRFAVRLVRRHFDSLRGSLCFLFFFKYTPSIYLSYSKNDVTYLAIAECMSAWKECGAVLGDFPRAPFGP